MEDSKIKNIVDKILIGIFTILCVIGFIMVACELPNFLNQLFNTTAFENAEMLSFFVCLALLGYVMKYYEDKKHDEQDKISMRHIKEMTGLENYWKFRDYENVAISSMEKNALGNIEMIIKDAYTVSIPLELFSKISTAKDFVKLDIYISTLFKDDTEESKVALEMKLTNQIEEYLKEYK